MVILVFYLINFNHFLLSQTHANVIVLVAVLYFMISITQSEYSSKHCGEADCKLTAKRYHLRSHRGVFILNKFSLSLPFRIQLRIYSS